MAYIVNPRIIIKDISIKFTENIMYKTEFFALDLYFDSWMGSTEYKRAKDGTNTLQFEYRNSELVCYVAGLDDGFSNRLPLKNLNFEVDLKTKSNILVSHFDAKFYTLELNKPTERVIKLWAQNSRELATIVFVVELDGNASQYFDSDLPRFDQRGVINEFGKVGQSNTYPLCLEANRRIAWDSEWCIERGRVGIDAAGKVIGGASGPFDAVLQTWSNCQEEIVSVVIAGIIVDNGEQDVSRKSKTSRKSLAVIMEESKKPIYSLKLSVDARFGRKSRLVVMSGGQVLFTQTNGTGSGNSPPTSPSHRTGEGIFCRHYHTYTYEVTGIKHGSRLEIVLQSTVLKKKVTNSALERMKATLSQKAQTPVNVYTEVFNSNNRHQLYAAADVRYISVEVIKQKRPPSAALDAINAPLPRANMPIGYNPIPLRTSIRPLSANASRPGSPNFDTNRISLQSGFTDGVVESTPNYVLSTTQGTEFEVVDSLECKLWKAKAAEVTDTGAWDERQLKAFRIFHRRSAILIRREFGDECCLEYMKRVQKQSCRDCQAECRWLNEIDAATDDDESDDDHQALISNLLRYETSRHSRKTVQSVEDEMFPLFPEYCLKYSCSGQYLYVYRSQRYLEKLTYGLVGEGAGWILQKPRIGFDWDRWIERDKGYARKAKLLEFLHKKSVYDQPWVEKWVCRECGGTMPYNEDDEIRRDLARLKRLSVMFGELEDYSSDEEDDGAINYTTMKVSADKWCFKCKQQYKPVATWNPVRWEHKMKEYAKIRNSHLMTIREEMESEAEKKYQRNLPQTSAWWKTYCKRKEQRMRGTSGGEFKLLNFAFSGSPFKFRDTVNLGGTLWERLVAAKSNHETYISSTGRSKFISIEYDGIGEGCCIDKRQAKHVSTKVEWNIAGSSPDLLFSLDKAGTGLTEVLKPHVSNSEQIIRSTKQEAIDDETILVEPSRALVQLKELNEVFVNPTQPTSANEQTPISPELAFSDSISKSQSTVDDYSDLINREGSFGEESILQAYAVTAGVETIPDIVEVIFCMPSTASYVGRGNFSVGMFFSSIGTQQPEYAGAPLTQFGKDMFSWGICEELKLVQPTERDNQPETKKQDSVAHTSDLTGSMSGIEYGLYERGRKLQAIPPLLPDDRIRILLDPTTGRLTISVLTKPMVYVPPPQVVSVVPKAGPAGLAFRSQKSVAKLPLAKDVQIDPESAGSLKPQPFDQKLADIYDPCYIGRHYTFRVPSASLTNYEIGCTLNENQKICLLPSASEEVEKPLEPIPIRAEHGSSVSKPLPSTNDARQNVESLKEAKLKPVAPILGPATTDMAVNHDRSRRGSTHSDKQPSPERRLERSLTIMSLSQKQLPVIRRTSAAAVSVQSEDIESELHEPAGGVAADSVHEKGGVPKLDFQGSIDINKCSVPLRTGRRLEKYEGSRLHTARQKSKFAARRRNAVHSLGLHDFEYPSLIDRGDSELPWMIGVPGVVPKEALQQAGFVGLQYDVDDDYDAPAGIFSKDKDRELFLVRVQYIVPARHVRSTTGEYVAVAPRDLPDKDTVKIDEHRPDSRWALGCCVRGNGRQAQTIWIEKTIGDLNYVSLLMTNPNVSTGRIQYLVDSKISKYRWRKGAVQFLDPKTGTIYTSRKHKSNEEHFEIPPSALRAVHEMLGDWEIIQYAVRAEIDNCIWIGVYYRHIIHNNAEDGVLAIKHLHKSQIATKLPNVHAVASDPPTSLSSVQPLPVEDQLTSSPAMPLNSARSEEKSVLPDFVQQDSVTTEDREMAEIFARARSFVLVEDRKQSEHEYALFAFMGTIREVHVTQVEFLCLA